MDAANRMRRDTRYNLVFLVVICALSAPGAVILFRKKMDPKAPAMYLPHPVHQTMSAVDPRPAPEKVERVLGPELTGWIRGFNWGSLFAGSAPMAQARILAASRHRTFQMAVIERDSARIRAGLVGWSGPATDRRLADRLEFVAGSDQGPAFPGRLVRSDRVPVPLAVRRELQDAGYIIPPADVQLLAVEFQPVPAPEANARQGAPLWITIRCAGCGSIEEDTVRISTP